MLTQQVIQQVVGDSAGCWLLVTQHVTMFEASLLKEKRCLAFQKITHFFGKSSNKESMLTRGFQTWVASAAMDFFVVMVLLGRSGRIMRDKYLLQLKARFAILDCSRPT